jgi:hypothetical protein
VVEKLLGVVGVDQLLRAHPWCIYELLSLITAQDESRVWAALGLPLAGQPLPQLCFEL